MLEMELNTSTHTYTYRQSSGGMWCHFTHSAMSVNQFITIFYQSLQVAVCVISVQLVWIRIMLCFFFFFPVAGAVREQNNREKREKSKQGK